MCTTAVESEDPYHKYHLYILDWLGSWYLAHQMNEIIGVQYQDPFCCELAPCRLRLEACAVRLQSGYQSRPAHTLCWC